MYFIFFFCRNASPSHLSLTDPTTGNSISSYAPVTWNGNSRCEEKAVGLFPSPHFAPLDLPSPPVFVQVIYRIEFLIKLEYISCFAPFGSPATIFSFTWMCAWWGEKRWKPGSELLRRVDPIPPSEHSAYKTEPTSEPFEEYLLHIQGTKSPLPPLIIWPLANPRPPFCFWPLFSLPELAETCETYFASFMSSSRSSFYFFAFLFLFSPLHHIFCPFSVFHIWLSGLNYKYTGINSANSREEGPLKW